MVEIESEGSNSLKPPSYYSAAMPAIKYHPDYYLEKGNLTIEVQDTLYKISDIKFWTHSDFFNIVAKENGTTVEEVLKQEKQSGPRIWKLHGVEPEDFTRLLWILYPLDHGKSKAKSEDDWAGILKLADHWKFIDIYNMSIRELAQLDVDPVRKIELMHRHKIRKEWVTDALVKLALQPTFPDIEQTRVFDIEITTNLAKTRERVKDLPFWSRGKFESAREIVCEVFQLKSELKDPPSWSAV